MHAEASPEFGFTFSLGELLVLFLPLYQGILAFATVKHAISKGHRATLWSTLASWLPKN